MPERRGRVPQNETMTLVQEAERAEKIRNGFISFLNPLSDDHDIYQDISKAVAELTALSCALREIDRLIEVDDDGSGLLEIYEDLKFVHDEVAFILSDIWHGLGRLHRDRTPEDYRDTWKEISAESWENNKRSLHSSLENSKRYLESLCKKLDSHINSPTLDELRDDFRTAYVRRQRSTSRPNTPMRRRSSQRRPSLSRGNSVKLTKPAEIKQPKSYERQRPMSPDGSSSSSISDTTRIRSRPWAPTPPMSPTSPPGTMSSISQVSSNAPSLETSYDHWAKYVFKKPPATALPWSNEETRYHEIHGAKELEFPNQSYEPVLTLSYPEGVRVQLFCRPYDYRAKIVAMYRDRNGKQEYACLLLEELHLRREGSVLRLCRRRSSGKPLTWLTLKFTTLERMVLFAGTFIAMRSQDSTATHGPTQVRDDELRDEVSEFAGSIIDNGFHHALRIYQDRVTNCVRLQASVLNGELDRTPVWTAFITSHLADPNWCRVNERKRTVHLAEVRLHIFSARYRPIMEPNRAFMLRFETKDDALSFVDVIDHLRVTSGSYDVL